MRRLAVVAAVVALLGVLLVLMIRRDDGQATVPDQPASAPPAPVRTSPPLPAAPADQQGFLYGRITRTDGTVVEGRLRFGGSEEAFWNDWFNGTKAGNPWAARVPREQLEERRMIRLFGIEFPFGTRRRDLDRPFMSRFGDIARIEAGARTIRVTRRSGTVIALDRFGADDLADGVRVWIPGQDTVDIGEWSIRSIEFEPTRQLDAAPQRLRGTVRTHAGTFSGFVQWNRSQRVGSDELRGRTAAGGQRTIRFDAIHSIERVGDDASRVTLHDGSEIVLAGARDVGEGHRGVSVDDERYGRVLVSWDTFERIDFAPAADSGPGYDDFPPGRPLAGSVTTRDGRRLAGRLVFDLDESETTDTLDAPSGGVQFTIPFALVASIVLPEDDEDASTFVRVMLHSGEALGLERRGDLGEANAGLLVFPGEGQEPTYVPWQELARLDLDRPPATTAAYRSEYRAKLLKTSIRRTGPWP
ncbi:MAG: hypothetical protein D6738_02615 [Acidobacteria bacterium]|nr:MAG: hypothetical protein D6738_02615 [Acidobacteriota bacterium]